MSKENKSRYALLGALSLQPMSGYDLKKFIEEGTGKFWTESYAQIYPVLKQLTKEGLTVSHVERQEGRPERHVYSLTDQGLAALRAWLADPAERQVPRNELLLKLFFGRLASQEVNLEHVQRFRATILQSLQTYAAIEYMLQEQYAASKELPYWLMTLSYGKHEAQALLSWCDETMATLQRINDEK